MEGFVEVLNGKMLRHGYLFQSLDQDYAVSTDNLFRRRVSVDRSGGRCGDAQPCQSPSSPCPKFPRPIRRPQGSGTGRSLGQRRDGMSPGRLRRRGCSTSQDARDLPIAVQLYKYPLVHIFFELRRRRLAHGCGFDECNGVSQPSWASEASKPNARLTTASLFPALFHNEEVAERCVRIFRRHGMPMLQPCRKAWSLG